MTGLINPRKLPIQKRPLSAASWDLLRQADAMLEDAATVQRSSVRDFRRIIDKVPKDERGLDWVERVILIYVVKGEKHSRCKHLTKRSEQARLKAGQKDEWIAFRDRLRGKIETYLLNDHKFNFTFYFSDQTAVAQELRRVTDHIAGLGYDVFINSGTLLGAVRSQSFIAHDNDVDLAVVIPGQTDEEVLKGYYAFYDRMRGMKGAKLLWRSKKKRPVYKLDMDSGVRIDVFLAWVRDGMFYVWPHTHGEIPVTDVLPLTTQTIAGCDLPAPRVPEKMLALNYGPNWQSPDPTFVFPWDEAERKFADVLAKYRRDRRWDILRSFLMPWKR